MPWSRKLSKPITLKDGSVIETLADGRDLIPQPSRAPADCSLLAICRRDSFEGRQQPD
jgi:hypothetical protein